MDKTTKWLIRVTACFVIVGIGGAFYINNNERTRTKTLEAERYCKTTPTYREWIVVLDKAIRAEEVQERAGYYLDGLPSSDYVSKKAAESYLDCVDRRMKR
ncbi:hypothetical protein [Prochlorococcus marinus]|uniref:hypothetical protein n=1 Tax=Prochlorococcus marinus TaxID=1219 RepID=UPI0022B5BA22|nr:hypothetical protein [Prochlorococcus marinus]